MTSVLHTTEWLKNYQEEFPKCYTHSDITLYIELSHLGPKVTYKEPYILL